MEKILRISLNLNYTSNTLGSNGLSPISKVPCAPRRYHSAWILPSHVPRDPCIPPISAHAEMSPLSLRGSLAKPGVVHFSVTMALFHILGDHYVAKFGTFRLGTDCLTPTFLRIALLTKGGFH